METCGKILDESNEDKVLKTIIKTCNQWILLFNGFLNDS
jgi:hypothetical protein